MPCEEDWGNFDEHYVPKDTWNSFLGNPSIRTLAVEGKRSGSRSTHVQVIIEPSKKVSPGVFIQVNEHYDINATLSPASAIDYFLEALQSSWDDFFRYWESVAETLVNTVKEDK